MKPTSRELTETILSVFPNAERILLFGSRANGQFRSDSDYDLLVVVPTTMRPARRGATLRLALRRFTASFDLLVVTPDEFEELVEMKSSAVYSAVVEGQVLHEVA